SAAIFAVVTGGTRFGMTMARRNCCAVNGATDFSTSPSRKWTCQSSGLGSVNRVMRGLPDFLRGGRSAHTYITPPSAPIGAGPSSQARFIARIFWLAPGRPSSEVFIALPRGERSAGRRGGLRDPLSGWRSRPRRLRGVSFLLAIGGRRLPALHLRRFLSPWGRASGRRQAMTALIRSGGHRSFIVHTCSPARGQPVVMPADGWLGASRVRLTRPGRGRRIDETGFPASSGETTRPHLRPAPHRCSVL